MEQTLPAGHPVHTYMLEADLIYSLMDELLGIDPHTDYQKFYNVFNHLATVEKHFARKENQLFPFLEKRGWTKPFTKYVVFPRYYSRYLPLGTQKLRRKRF